MIKIYHNSRCRKSREGLQIVQESGLDFELSLPFFPPLPVPVPKAGKPLTEPTAPETFPPRSPAAITSKFVSSCTLVRWLFMQFHKYVHDRRLLPSLASRINSILEVMAFHPLNFSQGHWNNNARS